jgi:hypothetical protein
VGTVLSYATTDEPLLLTGQDGITDQTFRQLRQMTQRMAPGVEGSGDYQVTPHGGTMSVDVYPGFCWVPATPTRSGEYASNTKYGVPLSTAKTLDSITAPVGATRRDIIVVHPYDAGDRPGDGNLNEGRVQYIKNASETLVAEATPTQAELLAWCDVPVGATAITAGMLTDKRRYGGPVMIGEDGKRYTMRVDSSGMVILRNITDSADVAPPRVKVRRSGSLSVATAALTTFVAVPWDTEEYDTAAMHDAASNTSRLIAPVAGTYQVEAMLPFVAAASGVRRAILCKNSAGAAGNVLDVDSRAGDAGTYTPLRLSTTLELAANDYVEAFVTQNSGGTVNVQGGAYNTTNPTAFMTMRRVDKGA